MGGSDESGGMGGIDDDGIQIWLQYYSYWMSKILNLNLMKEKHDVCGL